MTSTPARLDRRPARRRFAWLVLLCAAGAWLLAAVVQDVQRNRRAERLIVEIRQAGIDVRPGMSVWERLWYRVRHREPAVTMVSYRGGPSYNHRWLGERNYLKDLKIGALRVEAAEYGHELAWIVEQHPIERLDALSASHADLIARKLAHKRSLRMVDLRRSDLTDEGLRQLPLEQLHRLDIAQTAVTAQGLLELQRCGQLRSLTLDGRQFQPELVATLNQCPLCDTLTLVGPEVNIASVMLVHDLQNIRSLRLSSTSVRPGSPQLTRALSSGSVKWIW